MYEFYNGHRLLQNYTRWARCWQSDVWARNLAVSMGDQYSGFDNSCRVRIGGGSSGSDPESSYSSVESSSGSLWAVGKSFWYPYFDDADKVSRLINNFLLPLSLCCCWDLEDLAAMVRYLSLLFWNWLSLAPRDNLPLFRNSIGELALLVAGVLSDSSSLGVVEFKPTKDISLFECYQCVQYC